MVKEKTDSIRLRTVGDLVDFNERLLNKQINGQIDAKSVDGINTTVKGQKALLVDIPMQLFKLALQASIKKVQIDPEMFKRLGLPNPVMTPTAEN